MDFLLSRNKECLEDEGVNAHSNISPKLNEGLVGLTPNSKRNRLGSIDEIEAQIPNLSLLKHISQSNEKKQSYILGVNNVY